MGRPPLAGGLFFCALSSDGLCFISKTIQTNEM